MGTIKYVGALLMISLFAIAVVTYAINFASDNNSAITLADDSNYSYLQTGLNSESDNFRVDVDRSSGSLQNATLVSGADTLRTGASVKGLSKSSVTGFKLVLNTLKVKLFGNEFGIVFTTLISFIVFVGILYIIKLWLGKNPD